MTELLPPIDGIRLLAVAVEHESVRLQLTATAPTAACPRCAVPSSSVHSRYQRRLTDLPWGRRAVHIQLTVRKFRCRNPACGRRIFTERVPDWSVRESSPRIWGSRSFGTKNNDPLELFVFVSFCERLSYLSLRPIHCAEAVSSFMIEAGTPSMKADTVSDALLEAGKRWVQGVFEHVRDRDAQTRQLFASHCVV